MDRNIINQHLTLNLTKTARQHPHHIAIKSETHTVSYRQLEERSNQWANYVYKKNKEAQNQQQNKTNNVMIILDRSPEIIQCIMGLLKAGMVFAPVNPLYPAGRIQLLIDQIHPCLLVTSTYYYEKYKDVLEQKEIQQILILIDRPEGKDRETQLEKENRELEFDCIYNKYCYIYFTSGSTGTPNGVLGRHRSLVHFVQWEVREFEIDETFKISQFTNPSFDMYLKDIFVPLAAGGTCCIPHTDTLMNPVKLAKWIDESEITLIHNVPSLFKMWAAEVIDANCFQHLKYVHISGELLRGKDIKRFVHLFGERIQLVNLYGPTEITVIKFFHRIPPENVNRVFVPVGKPIPGAQALVLDKNKQKCLIGNIGEVFIRTPFISSGYFNKPDLTKKKFLRNPFSNNPQDIIYKTGDQGRILEDGTLELLGRTDDQVKIRGMRLETGEIENQLLEYPDIKETVVLPHQDGNDSLYLCAYIVPDPGKDFKINELKKYLAHQLPAYMIPAHFLQVDTIPLTPNGKIDKGALPKPPRAAGKGVKYEPPQNEVQKNLVQIWCSLLKMEKVSINDNFFDLGGESLNMMKLTGLIYKQYHLDIPLMQMFKRATIKEISRMITDREFDEEPYILLGRTSTPVDSNPSTAPGRNIFCFPPAQGFGLQYRILAPHLQGYSLYAFNFLEDMAEEQRLNQYVEIITKNQASGPYILMGWSAGGALTFQTARKLEKQGYQVTDIILIDSTWNLELKQAEHTELNEANLENLKNFLESFGIGYLKDKVEKRMRQYVRYNNQLNKLELINATVHFIASSERKNIRETAAWENFTRTPPIIYNGLGSHSQMLEPGFINQNAEIIKQIIDKIFVNKYN